MRNHLIQRLTERARVDGRVFLITGDLGYSVIEKFQDEFPTNFLNVGVSEQAGVGIAAGLSKTHLPVFYSIANFSSFRCLEQVRNDVSHEGNPVMVVSLGAGFTYGTAGYSHFAIEDASAVASIFGISVFTPACVHELDSILDDYWKWPVPTYLRIGSQETCLSCLPSLTKYSYENVATANSDKVLVVTHGEIGKSVASAIGPSGEDFRLISIPRFNSLDSNLLQFVGCHKRVITVEEHSKDFGFGARLRAQLAMNNFDFFKILGIPKLDFHIGGKRDYQLERSGLAGRDFVSALEEARLA